MMRNRHQQSGFTIIELIVVVVLSSILAAFAIPRFFNPDSFNERGFVEESKSVIRAAQKIAIASNCHIRVTFSSAGNYILRRWIFCRLNPGTHSVLGTINLNGSDGEAIASNAPNNITVSNLDFYFDQIGRPRNLANSQLIQSPSDLDLLISGSVIQIEPLTGYIR